ncbi:MAG: PDZ domain-containing protein [Deltaproteobacteria bacterium]|nr:PDZ domain-containing protein [Deltaproteobacteria bacterium]
MKKIFIFAFLFICFTDVSFARDSWHFEWRIDEMTDNVSCLVFSEHKSLRSGYGKKSSIYLSVQDNGAISIHSKDTPFDPAKYKDIGIRTDINDALFGVSKGYNTSMVQFTPERSLRLLNEMRTGRNLKVRVVFFPEGKLKKLDFPLLGDFAIAISSWSGCHQLKNNNGWGGIYFVAISNTPEWIELLKKKKIEDTLGVMIFTINPKKAGSASGLNFYDVILKYDGKPASVDGLLKYFAKMKNSEIVQLEVLRGKKIKKINLTKP